MKSQSLRVFERMYRDARKPEDLPWHDPDPPPQLERALARHPGGTALDVGCGGGTYSFLMARQGLHVTALDFMAQAVEMVRRGAAENGLSIDAAQADVAVWDAGEPFDVVLDVGCFHTPGSIAPEVYKRQLLRWLAPGGDFVLLHFGRRGWWDWWPIGPKRVYERDLVELFAPELTLVDSSPVMLTGMSAVLGFSALVGRYWFRREGG